LFFSEDGLIIWPPGVILGGRMGAASSNLRAEDLARQLFPNWPSYS
jgi:hypothetical protein